MKILVVGVFNEDWSTAIPMYNILKKSHKVFSFEFRHKNSKLNTNEIKRNTFTITNLLKKSYTRVNEKLEKVKHLPFFKILLNFNRFYLLGRWKLNRRLLCEIKKNKYDLVLLIKSDSINYNLIPKFNKYTHTWYFFMDPLYVVCSMDAYKYADLCRWSSSTFSSVYTLFKRYNKKSYFITQGCNTVVFKPKENVKKEFDVVFVGSISPKRKGYVDFLRNNDINVRCFGRGWEHSPVYLTELADIYRKSKVVLNFTREKAGFSIRVFQAMGTGTFLISEFCSDLKKNFTKGKHMEWFNNKEDLLQLINFHLNQDLERERIAKNGCDLIYNNYTWKHIMDKIISIVVDDMKQQQI